MPHIPQPYKHLDEGSYELVRPFQQHENKDRISVDTRNYFLANATSRYNHYKRTVIVVKSKFPSVAGVRLKLILHLNEHLLLGGTVLKRLDENGESAIDHVENCYYQGTVNGDPESFVAISSCNGIWGIIGWRNGTTLGIWPMGGGEQGGSGRYSHVLYRTKWTKDAACSAVTALSTTIPPPRSMALRMPWTDESLVSVQLLAVLLLSMEFCLTLKSMPYKRDASGKRMKHLKLALIGDQAFVSPNNLISHSTSTTRSSLQMREFNFTEGAALEYMLNAINVADLIFIRDLRVRVSVVYAELWLDAQRVDLHADLQQTLDGALGYATGHIYDVQKDATLMFTSGSFSNGEMLTSTFSSVCTAKALALVKVGDAHFAESNAQLVIHSLGHVLGIDHDSHECSCRGGSAGGCIMTKQAGSIGSHFTWEFSQCSVARFENVVESEYHQCLMNRPFQSSQLGNQCGNGVVDGEEECDCGRRDQCTDPCCDPLTCTLRPHARCASHQACCHRCEYRHSGHICREAKSYCDVPEFCDGLSADCPTDGHLVDGVPCGIDGQCWKGNCSDLTQQCKALWGAGAEAAEDPCFSHNEKGAEYGNCGVDRNDEFFLPCTPTNNKCGTLHCRGGSPTPLLSSHTSFNLQFPHDDKRQIQCKVIANDDVVGSVADGTNCGSGKVCIAHACVPLTQVSPPTHCPSNNLALQCSGHGDCTTVEKCLCYDGWTGTACDIRSNSSRRIALFTTTPSSATSNIGNFLNGIQTFKGHTLHTTTLLIILLGVGIALLLLLICLLFCYRRKSSARVHRTGLDEKVEEESLSHEDMGRAIKFAGQMPSYREEKRKRKKNKHIYDALQRINEAAEERDSVSLKSKESSTVNSTCVQQQPTPSRDARPNSTTAGHHHYRSNNSLTARSENGSLRLTRLASSFKTPPIDHTITRSLLRNPLAYGNEQRPLNLKARLGGSAVDEAMDGIDEAPLPVTTTPYFTSVRHESDPRIASSSPTRSDYAARTNYSFTRHELGSRLANGYATDTEIQCTSLRQPSSAFRRTGSRGGLGSHDGENGVRLVEAEGDDGVTPPLRLQSIQMLMRRLNPQERLSEEMEMCNINAPDFGPQSRGGYRATTTTYPEPPPASTDSGHPASSGSNYDIRESPSLFSDAFKLDLSN